MIEKTDLLDAETSKNFSITKLRSSDVWENKKMTFGECGDIMKLNKSTERSTKLGHKNIAEHLRHWKSKSVISIMSKNNTAKHWGTTRRYHAHDILR